MMVTKKIYNCQLWSNVDPVSILYAVGCQQLDSSLKCSVEILRPIYNAASFLEQENRVWNVKHKNKEIMSLRNVWNYTHELLPTCLPKLNEDNTDRPAKNQLQI